MNRQPSGFVYVQTNDAEQNEVVVYRRGGDGRLDRLGSYLTGGKGSGRPHLPSQASVLLADGRLFVTNAGSDDVTVFAVQGEELVLLDRSASGGSAPTSVAVRGPWVYVLNSQGAHTLSGYALDGDGRLSPLAGATRNLGDGSDPAQVAFSPDGQTLVVTDRAADAIHAFSVGDDGIVAEHAAHPSAGMTPYGFDFAPDGTLVVTEAAGAQVGKASASSYRLEGGGLAAISAAVPNTRSEVCWAVVDESGRLAFVTNFGDGTISTYDIGGDGTIALRDAVAATTVEGGPGLRDEALSADGRFLYALHADSRRVFAWAVGEDGTLAALGSADGLPSTAAGLAAS
jgi:6-phosphogluconolactonase